MKNLQGKVAVITGAASGIGRAMTDRFIAAGMKIVLADVDEVKLRNVEAELTENIESLPMVKLWDWEIFVTTPPVGAPQK